MIFPARFRPELCASRDATRYILNNVYLRGDMLYATDGRRMTQVLVVRDKDDVDGFIPIQVIAGARAAAGRRRGRTDTREVCIACHKDRFVFESRFGATTVMRNKAQADWKFPNVSQTIATKPVQKAHAITFDINLLYGAAMALGTTAITLSFDEPDKAIIVQTTNPSDVSHSVIMPVSLK